MSYWKERALKVINATLQQIPEGTQEKDIRKALSAAYPFGQRQYHPYKVWCATVNEVLKPTVKQRNTNPRPGKEQLSLFQVQS